MEKGCVVAAALGIALALATEAGAARLGFSIPAFGVDTLAGDCETPDPGIPQNIVSVRVWYAPRWYDGLPILARSRPVGPGPTDTLEVPDAPATWWVSFVNARGLESCLSNGYTVGIPAVSVPGDDSGERGMVRSLFDLRGARVVGPIRGLPDGVYFRRISPEIVFRIVVIEGEVVGARRVFPRRKAGPL